VVEPEWLAERFEEKRGDLRAVAYRMLGSLGDADDAVQEAWLRLSRSDARSIENLGAWLTTVVARVCLDMLRSRTRRGGESLDEPVAEPITNGVDPEEETLLAESVGLALLVVLDSLGPAERLAFVLHDLFAVSFDEIASIVERSPDAARQLASRARRRVRGTAAVPKPELALQREVAQAFLTALRGGDLEGLIAVLDPHVVVRLDGAAAGPGVPREIRGAENWAKRTVAFSGMFTLVQPALVDGEVGLIWAPRGRLLRVVRFAIADRKIVQVAVIAALARLRGMDVAILDS
jgi:RNA polymerase sigma factor (sigma-70 family)